MKSFVVATSEYKRLNKSVILLIGIVLIVFAPILLDPSILITNLKPSKAVIYSYLHLACLYGAFFIPLQTFSLYYHDENTDVLKIIYSNPILPFQYVIGKCIGAFFNFIQFVLFTSIIIIINRIFLDKSFNVVLEFINGFFMYLLPSIFFYIILTHFIQAICRNSIISVIISIFLFLGYEGLHEKFRFVIRGEYLQNLQYSLALSKELIMILLMNRIFYIAAGILLLLVTISIHSRKKI